MSEPLSDHLKTLMHGEPPSEEELRKQHEAAMADLEDHPQDESESEDSDEARSDEDLDDEESEDYDADEDDEGESEEDDDEPMSVEQFQAALRKAEEERDEARREADGRLKALRENRGAANELKGQIKDLEETVKSALPKEPEEPAPDKEEDPLGYVAWQQEHVVTPLVETVESLKGTIEGMQTHAMLSEIETGLNTHINERIGKNKALENEFVSARDYMIKGFIDQFVAEGVSQEEAAGRVRIIAANAGAEALRDGKDFVQFVVEEAKRAGWAPPKAEDPVKKVRRGQRASKTDGKAPSRANRRRGRKITSAMMEAPDGDALSHEEKLAIIGNDEHRKNLIERGHTYLTE